LLPFATTEQSALQHEISALPGTGSGRKPRAPRDMTTERTMGTRIG